MNCEVCHASYEPALEPDPCLGLLPGVSHACCGHGCYGQAYAVLGGEPGQSAKTIDNKVVLRGIPALEFFDMIRIAQTRGPERGPLRFERWRWTEGELTSMQKEEL